jgi:lysyl oxidase
VLVESGFRKVIAAAVSLGVMIALSGINGAPAATPPSGTATERLPDLNQVTPSSLRVTRVRSGGRLRWRLGFRSAVANVGKGPLLIVGTRPSPRARYLATTQVVALRDGSTHTYPSPGKLYYERFSDHQHFHLRGFAHYELRRARDGRVARPSLKRGFCLEDSYRLRGIADPPEPVYDVGYDDTDCGRNRRHASRVEEGLSVAWADDYDPFLEGQQIDVTGLRSGVYELANRSNIDRSLRESRYDNNGASLRIRVSWPRGYREKPRIATLRRCPTRPRCGPRS